MHPSFEYALVCCVAAAGSFLLTPLARAVAIAWKAVAMPRDRDVHAVATPRLGGLAMLGGLIAAFGVAHMLPTLQTTFTNPGADIGWIVISGVLICLLGVLDDRYDLDSVTKLAGQVLVTGLMVTKGGVQLSAVYVPWGHAGTVVLGQDIAIPVTILMVVLTINAINFIDGLDGLAAGVSAIGAGAFFLYAYHLAVIGHTDIAAAPTLLAACLVGTCVGFLPHNFSPARIFMGDSGSMLIGLFLSAAATTATTSGDPQTLFGNLLGSLPLALPLLVPLAVLAIPFMDLVLAVLRRLRRRQSPFAADKEHLHHRMLEIGHTHRRAVLLLYFWSALLSFGAVAFSITRSAWAVVSVVAVLAFLGVLLSAVPRLRSPRPEPAPISWPTDPPVVDDAEIAEAVGESVIAGSPLPAAVPAPIAATTTPVDIARTR
ncbi:UDP-GlcNAc:undecaprenyl-phosphate GlcNAc-1-phosphate transferase [Jatrophihabitans sp. GAS493]|uniref:glycosyltransferase family 4 protein n=1 Tax=Jatrophihabitans sp. GAS493 TaxID=1907575 RepID=UPI000BB94502|nr:MraY family glycosyltransferase [Jatrophihabitans sp. GAS493]SOD73306.1 UDP-GlcNAc:undecaprenyl-phosphate GlcNAc-1-phosphate transferase [Jatrophihabitans sp. GAS493]